MPGWLHWGLFRRANSFTSTLGLSATTPSTNRKAWRGSTSRRWRSSTTTTLAWVVDALEAILASTTHASGRQLHTIRVVGGGSQNRLLNQMTADASGCTVVTGPVEAAALGVLMMQAVATGH
ncbi:MAG: FGGY-family carbohydrate kinase, partial [Caldilinea sp.]|nr:FGGY-family carbohydrate kinase [Caldilinea sp.]